MHADCGNSYCKDCIESWAAECVAARRPATCPLCNGALANRVFANRDLERLVDLLAQQRSGTKRPRVS